MRILITGIGSDIAQATARVIRDEFPNAVIIGADIHNMHAGHFFCDEMLLSCRADSVNFIGWLKEAIVTKKIDIYIPLSEAELRALSVLGELPSVVSDAIIWAGNFCATKCLDKLKTFQFLELNGVHIPWTKEPSHLSEIKFPCIFKMRESAGSKNIFICKNEKEAVFLNDLYGENAIFQELLSPSINEITCPVYLDKDNVVHVLQLQRKLSGGLTGWCKTVNYEEVRELCKKVVHLLKPECPINIQLILTDQGPRIFEINPRISSTALIRDKMGFQDVRWMINAKIGKPQTIDSNVELGIIGYKLTDAEICHEK
ncbi:ATP-grasp domain-containing protein [Chromobacterium piscinae]|uniref:ATP-grasp domain-containing protein n=1 Tax=Chromobacterium piscinae TaxID=686831 RepID=UPI001E48AA8D|nr:ATP-grasp domain-containing protein [Chromobacterium piscinae]MCD4506179.1 ATP-grasp domain-containing protein [Chromobacterium piscinae]